MSLLAQDQGIAPKLSASDGGSKRPEGLFHFAAWLEAGNAAVCGDARCPNQGTFRDADFTCISAVLASGPCQMIHLRTKNQYKIYTFALSGSGIAAQVRSFQVVSPWKPYSQVEKGGNSDASANHKFAAPLFTCKLRESDNASHHCILVNDRQLSRLARQRQIY